MEGNTQVNTGKILTRGSSGSLTEGDSSAYAYFYKSNLTESEGGGLQVVNNGTVSGNHLISAGSDSAGQVDNEEGGVLVDAAYAGLALKYETGPWLFAAALTGSYGWYDTERGSRSRALPAPQRATSTPAASTAAFAPPTPPRMKNTT